MAFLEGHLTPVERTADAEYHVPKEEPRFL